MDRNLAQNKERAKTFAKEILEKIEIMIAEHNDKVRRKNDDFIKTGKVQKITPTKSPNEEQFYKYAEDATQKLSLLGRKVASAEKIKKESRLAYEGKLAALATHMRDATSGRSVGVGLQSWMVRWVQDMGQQVDQVQKSLLLLEKESRGFCFGGDTTTQDFVQRGVLDLIGYSQVWQLLPRYTPLIEREVQSKYLELDYDESVFRDIDKMVVALWPDPQVKEIIVEQLIVKDREKSNNSIIQDTSIKHELQRRELHEKNQKLMKENQVEKTLREAHEMLVGLGRPQNISKAIETYLSVPEISQSQAREEGKTETELRINPLICNILGCLYQEGKYLPRDLNKACEYYIKSASVQDPEGLYKIARFLEKRMVNPAQLFEEGYATRSEEVRDAIQHYEKAAQKGHLDAITDLGHIYENGVRLEENRNEHSAVSQSEVSSATRMEDYLIEPNHSHALKYYSLAKKQDFPRALNNLGAMYVRLADRLPETVKGSNLQRGLKYLKRATELKYGKAFLNYGKCFEKGLGVKKNLEKARSLYIEGAELDDSQCKLQFIKCMLSNQITTEDKVDIKIHQYLRQILLAQPNNAEAMHLMGVFQEKGYGVEVSPDSAYYYIHKAAKLEYPPSLIKLGDYYYSGYHIGKNISKAKICYEKAAMRGSSQGFINLGLLYQNGLIQLDSQADRKQIATNYFLEAAKIGDPNALLFLNKEGASSEQMKQAAEMGSSEALKLLAKTSTTAAAEAKTFEKSKSQYKNLVNKFIKEANRLPDPIRPRADKRDAPISPRMREMMIYSPRERPHTNSNVFSTRYLSPSREGVRSHPYFHR